MKKVNTGGFIVIPILLLIVLGVVVAGYIYFADNSKEKVTEMNNSVTETGNSIKEFKSSDVLDFTVDVPTNLAIEDGGVGVRMYSNYGDIKIGKNGTNFNNLNDYFNNHATDPLSRMSEKRTRSINGLDAVSGIDDNGYVYYIYVDNRVYIFSTSSETLYDDLDLIAQSFRYTPN